MSSPITNKKRNIFDKALISFHQGISHNHRINILADEIAQLLSNHFEDTKPIRCLDIGCGDMQLAERISVLMPSTDWQCIDIHKLPDELKTEKRWQKYKQFDGVEIPFDNQSFEVAMICDALHHMQANQKELLTAAARTSRLIIVKDHFEYSLWSRSILKLMDFIGNWGYGIWLPKRYFSQATFDELVLNAGLTQIKLQRGIDLYSHIPLLGKVLKPKWQFIALLKTC